MNGDPGDSFSARLSAARELRGLSQAELAKRAGIQSSTIAHFEGGRRKPSFDNFVKLVEALEVPADFLIGRADKITLPPESDKILSRLAMLSSGDRELAKDLLAVLIGRKINK